MSQSLTQIYVHIVFSTKLRQPFLQEKDVRDRMLAYLATVAAERACPAVIVGGAEDHVHLLCRLGKAVAVCDLIRDLKRASSLWVKPLADGLAGFAWQNGYGAFSLSPGHVGAVTDYVARQWEHHHPGETYQDEFRRLCAKYGLEIDERYCWD